MKKVLVPVDGSVRTCRAVKYLIELTSHGERFEVVVMNVQPKPKLWQTRGTATKAIFERLRMLGEAATAHCLTRLAEAEIAHKCRLVLADSEIQAIAQCAQEEGCDHIVMADEELNPVAQKAKAAGVWPFRSLAAKVVDRTDLPVTVIRPFSIERIERSGTTDVAGSESTSPTGRIGIPYRHLAQ